MRSRILNRLALAAIVSIAPLAPAASAASGAPQTPQTPQSPRPPQTFGILNATFPLPGVMAAGQPTGEQLQLLAEEGYHAVIDLRPPDEPHGFDEPEATKQNGLAYINIPVTPATLDQAAIDRFVNAMRTVERPVIVHCSTSNRVGALLYAWLVLEKKESPEQALEQARGAGLRNPELVEKVKTLVAERSEPGAATPAPPAHPKPPG